MGEQHKDFLALTHGEEWVNFYESFDKLVQDNLTRSSDLLKRAMTLPEVAGREVAKIKTDHEAQLADERDRQRAVLSDLRNEITASHQQVSALSKGMTAILADLERLSGRITTALASVEAPASVAAEPAPTAPVVAAAPAPAAELPVVEPPVAEAAPAEPVAATPEEPIEAAPAAEMDAPVEEESPAEEPAAIDLTALAEAEVESTPEPAPAAPAEGELVGAANGTAERQRPHWLSVTRLGSSGNN